MTTKDEDKNKQIIQRVFTKKYKNIKHKLDRYSIYLSLNELNIF